MELLRFRLLRLMAGSGIKAKVLGGFLSSKGLLTGNVVELVTMKMRKKIKTIACLLRVGYTKCNRVAQCFLTLGTKLRLVLSFFTLRSIPRVVKAAKEQ